MLGALSITCPLYVPVDNWGPLHARRPHAEHHDEEGKHFKSSTQLGTSWPFVSPVAHTHPADRLG